MVSYVKSRVGGEEDVARCSGHRLGRLMRCNAMSVVCEMMSGEFVGRSGSTESLQREAAAKHGCVTLKEVGESARPNG
jgi:hypothetical protein